MGVRLGLLELLKIHQNDSSYPHLESALQLLNLLFSEPSAAKTLQVVAPKLITCLQNIFNNT